MPQNYKHYGEIKSLVSEARLTSYQVTFKSTSDADLYGTYMWAQQAAGSIYPLTQNAEITLRNAIDREARKRFGEYWWKVIGFNGAAANKFLENIYSAERKLSQDWENKERKRLRLYPPTPLPTPLPIWSHDQIVAATDFVTWQHILKDNFKAPTSDKQSEYLWPQSMGKVFKHYDVIDRSPHKARKMILDLVLELREYRNRLFHHEPIWTKSNGSEAAIVTIRKKINRMETLIGAIDKKKLEILNKVGVFNIARRVCSLTELNIYRYSHVDIALDDNQKAALLPIAVRLRHTNTTTTWSHGGGLYGLHHIR